jgi:hypothetical protein
MMLRRLAFLVLLGASLASLGAVHAEHTTSLCGVAFIGRGDLDAHLRDEHARFFAGEGVTTAFVSSPTALTLWWLTEPKSRAYPAIACVEKRATSDLSLVLRPSQVDCRGASPAACGRLRRDISRAKF